MTLPMLYLLLVSLLLLSCSRLVLTETTTTTLKDNNNAADQEQAITEPEQVCVTAEGSSSSQSCASNKDTSKTIIRPFEAQDRSEAYGERQRLQAAREHRQDTFQRLLEVDTYMHNTVFQEESYQKVAKNCRNRHELCTFWAAIGECEANKAYMALQCAPACFSCDQLDFEARCPFNETLPDIWKAGDLNRMFERITSDPYYKEQYGPITILSRPETTDDETETTTSTNNNANASSGPWVVTLENFLTEQECQTLIELGAAQGYERSSDVGTRKFDGTFEANVNDGRTSRNAWCLNACYENETTQHILSKLENLTGIPDDNSEYLQLLKYEKDQYYQSHHDYIEHHVRRDQGVRILTVFLYLNDVPAGGGTRFTDLKQLQPVEPQRGKALLWPSVLDDNPSQKDRRTHHEAMPVQEGIKYGANAWIHLRDFKTPYAKSCI